ncbi:MAG: MFS transporter [Nitrospirota bacterium]
MSASSLHGSPWRALTHRNFSLFLTGHGLSLCGTWMQSMAQAWLLYRLTGSPFLLGLAEFLSRAPILAFGLVGGLLADRWPRHRIMFVVQGLLLVQAGLLAALTLSGLVTVEWILALALFMGLIGSVEVPVRQAFLTDLVPRPDIASAIGLNSSVFNTARIVGPSLAGLVASSMGEGSCFLINSLSFLIVLGCLAAIRVQPAPQTHQADVWAQLREGLHYAKGTPHVRAALALVLVISVAGMPYATLLPVFARDVLHRGPDGLGLLMAATGIGALGAALRLARRRTVHGLGAAIAAATGLFGLGLLALAASTDLWLSIVALLLIGFGMVSSLAGVNTLLQSLAPEALRGRVVSLYTIGSLGFTVFGSLLAGLGGSYLGAPLTVAAGGLTILIGAGLFWRALPAIRHHVREQGLLPPEPVVPQ